MELTYLFLFLFERNKLLFFHSPFLLSQIDFSFCLFSVVETLVFFHTIMNLRIVFVV